MKIIHLNTSPGGGGASKIAKTLQKLAIRSGYESIYIHKFEKKIINEEGVLTLGSGSLIDVIGARVLGRVFRELGLEYQPIKASKNLYQHLDPETILHFHNIHGNFFNIDVLSALSRRYKTIITMHDSWYYTGHCAHHFDCEKWRVGCYAPCTYLTTPPAIYRDNAARNFKKKIEALARSDVILTSPGKWMIEEISQIQSLDHLKKVHIANGIDLEKFSQESRFEIFGVIKIASIATHFEKNKFKEYSLILDAATQYSRSNPHLRVVLKCIGAKKGRIESDNLVIEGTGYLKTEDISNELKDSTLFLHLSRGETFGNAIVEAMASGLPVIGSNVGGIPEIIRNGINGLVIDNSIEEITKAIDKIVSNLDLYRRMSREAINISKQYDENEMYRKYEQLYL